MSDSESDIDELSAAVDRPAHPNLQVVLRAGQNRNAGGVEPGGVGAGDRTGQIADWRAIVVQNPVRSTRSVSVRGRLAKVNCNPSPRARPT